jgi:hypothetical protein
MSHFPGDKTAPMAGKASGKTGPVEADSTPAA